MTRPAVVDTVMGPLTEAAELLRAGTVTPGELTGACLERIDRIEPELRAWARVDAARALEQARSLGPSPPPSSPPLWGVPVGVKDNIETRGLATTAGSPLLAGNVPERDAEPVRRLRSAGAVVLGKTACTELATNDPAPTRNPWSARHSPGGSSAGSGAAVAARMCFATIDTQTAGDILRPAAYTGVVGFKPSYGQVSHSGVIPVAWSIDTVGFQARTVRDVALLSGVLSGTGAPGSSAPPDHAGAPRIGLIRDYFYELCDEPVRRNTDDVAEQLARAGATVEEIHPGVDFSLLHAAHRTVTFAECAAVHEDLYRRRGTEMSEKLRTLIELGLVTPAVSYVQAQRVRARLAAGLQRELERVDAVLMPVAPTTAPADLTGTGSSGLLIPWTFCGFPAVSIPTGLSEEGLPYAVQLAGAILTDQRLLVTADWCSRTVDARLPVPVA